jgi:hypothetical protein
MNEKDATCASSSVCRYVAVCDVLGFSHLVQTLPLENVFEGYREIIRDVLDEAESKERTFWPDGSTDEMVTQRVGSAVFSDSIIVWSRDWSRVDEPYPGAGVVNFFLFIGGLVLRSLRKTRCGLRFPIRAGIAYGAAAILPDEQIYLGKPIVHAYRMEQAQEWIGAACHPSCLQAPDFDIVKSRADGPYNYVTDYPVPIKEGRESDILDPDHPDLRPLAVAWPGMIWTLPKDPEDYYMKNIQDVLQTEKSRDDPAPSVVKKWENTLNFGMRFREFRDPEDKEPF